VDEFRYRLHNLPPEGKPFKPIIQKTAKTSPKMVGNSRREPKFFEVFPGKKPVNPPSSNDFQRWHPPKSNFLTPGEFR
jgi:hypothetical protein